MNNYRDILENATKPQIWRKNKYRNCISKAIRLTETSTVLYYSKLQYFKKPINNLFCCNDITSCLKSIKKLFDVNKNAHMDWTINKI